MWQAKFLFDKLFRVGNAGKSNFSGGGGLGGKKAKKDGVTTITGINSVKSRRKGGRGGRKEVGSWIGGGERGKGNRDFFDGSGGGELGPKMMEMVKKGEGVAGLMTGAGGGKGVVGVEGEGDGRGGELGTAKTGGALEGKT